MFSTTESVVIKAHDGAQVAELSRALALASDRPSAEAGVRIVSVPATSDIPSIVPSLEAVGRLLREGVLEVPLYQRSYAWTSQQVETYWFDLRAALVAGEPLYFLGTVVISSGLSERSTVIDGQQRLATSSMLFAAIRDAFLTRGDSRRAATVQDRYMTWASLESTATEPRLALNEHDNAFFKSVVVRREPDAGPVPEEADSVRLIRSAYRLLSVKLEEDVASAGPHWLERLVAWIEFLDRRVRVITVRVRDDADAFLIFETLNARGVELSAADLVKNYLLGLCRRTYLDEAQELWSSAVNQIEAAASSTETTTFLRQWWSSRHGAVREKELYRRIKLTIQSEHEAYESLVALQSAAPHFAAILNAEHEIWAKYPVGVRAAMTVLLDLGLEQYRPLLLSALQHFDEAEVELLMKDLISWSVRGLISGGIGGGTTERYYSEAAVRISNRRTSSTGSVLAKLEPVVASDDDFKFNFAIRRVLKTNLIHYYLRALRERTAIPTAEPSETVVVPILLRTDPREEWSHLFNTESLSRSRLQLGNYVLLHRDVVRSLPREPHQRIHDLTHLDLVQGLPRRIRSEVDIAERQRQLAAWALETWPRLPL